jgi:hypothetical protein
VVDVTKALTLKFRTLSIRPTSGAFESDRNLSEMAILRHLSENPPRKERLAGVATESIAARAGSDVQTVEGEPNGRGVRKTEIGYGRSVFRAHRPGRGLRTSGHS